MSRNKPTCARSVWRSVWFCAHDDVIKLLKRLLLPHQATFEDEEEAQYANGRVPVGTGKALHKPRKRAGE